MLLGLVWPAQAHNGAVAIAVPVEGIKVDGDLSDWPDGLRRYPIALPESGVAPRDSADYQGCFRLGYDEREQALYVAVEVQDESVVETPGASDAALVAPSTVADGCEVYATVDHPEAGGSVAQWVIWGDLRQVFGSARDGDARVAVRRGPPGATYEWRIAMSRVGQGSAPVRPGTVIGFDVVVGYRPRCCKNVL